MEKYCTSCGRVFDDLNFKICPYCGSELDTRYGRQPIPRQLRHEVFKRDGYRCRECGASKDETSLEIDHIVPVAKGGTNDIDNLQTLCRECNRMKHTDEWVGGETDLDVVKQELNSLKNQIIEAKQGLKIATTEDEKIEYEYQIMVLEEKLPKVEKKYNDLYESNKKIEAKRRREEKSKKLYKKLYVKIDDDAFLKWAEDNSISPRNKKRFIKSICNSSEQAINDYIYTIQLYKDLIDNPEKLKEYNKLFNELDKESLEILKDYSSLNFKKGLLILECINKYGVHKVREIIRNKREADKKKKLLKFRQKKILKVYEKYKDFSQTAYNTSYSINELYEWYIKGSNGHPDYKEFYKKINAIKRPSESDRKSMSKLNNLGMEDSQENLSMEDKQKIILQKLESYNSLDEAAEHANIPVNTVIKWYEYGQNGMVEFTTFYREVNKIINSNNNLKQGHNSKKQMLMNVSYSELLNVIHSNNPNDIKKFNLHSKKDFINYLCNNYSLDELNNMFFK